MGRRKQRVLLQASGSLQHNGKRYAGLGAALKHFDKAHAAIWRELASLAPPGVLANSDRAAVEVACPLTAKMRDGKARGGDVAQFTTPFGKLAMTPADRSKVQVSAPEMEADDR